MHALRTLMLFGLLLLAPGAEARRSSDIPGQFDYYTVALSWSPSYCATRRDPDQCATGRRLGFVLHGLWPQYESGYPQECSNEQVSHAVRMRYTAIYPSPKLLGHEWRKHGTCSGLDPAAYFALSARLKDQVRIPDAYRGPATPLRVSHRQVVQAFEQANPGMARDSVLPFCAAGGRFLSEVRACFTREGKSRPCSNGEIKRSYGSCRQETFLIQNVR